MKPCKGCAVYLEKEKQCRKYAPRPTVEPRIDIEHVWAYWCEVDGLGCGERVESSQIEKLEG